MVTVSDGRGGGGKGMQLGMGNAARPPSDAAPIAGPPRAVAREGWWLSWQGSAATHVPTTGDPCSHTSNLVYFPRNEVEIFFKVSFIKLLRGKFSYTN